MGCGVSSTNNGAPYQPDVAGSGGVANLAAALDTDESAEEVVAEDISPEKQEKLNVVRDVYIFRHLSPLQLSHLVDSFKVKKYQQGQKVIAQNTSGDTFFVVASGELEVFIDSRLIRQLGKHAYFGERALLFDEPRTATVQACSKIVEAWAFDKVTFLEIVKGQMQQQLMYRIRLQDTSVTMDDLKTIRPIGEGAAGEVDLVEHKKTKTRYALKKVKKEDGKLPTEVQREMDLLKMNDHPFVMQLVKTFETDDLAYMLVELITGGELHAAIRTIPTVLSAPQAQFYVGSLALALEALHSRRIIYRDLKPENVMLDNQGYLKIIDFGIAKKLEVDKARTFTMVGTPHYMAPEVMRGRGYNSGVDHWALGVILFELTIGYLPFANDVEGASEVFAAVIKGRLEFPGWYNDARGNELMRGLMCHDPKKRLGSGPGGFEEVKRCSWFMPKRPGGTHIFDQLMGRELEAPVVPKGEVFGIDQTED
mmetsp:Transcript_50742/g.145626  ORF Transcript_50742/g.145626 Transcript_50742/m.145626 type:complete len:480 (-) Transcript_50742:161-1600(-)